MIEPTDSIDPSDPLFEWESLAEDSIELSSEQIEQAIQISQSLPNPAQQWQLYLQTLALFGFKQWLAESAADLAIDDAGCSVYQPAYANLIEAACNLQVGPLTLCTVVIGAVPSLTVHLPRAVVDLPQFVPHFYVLMQVLEDQDQVRFCGYLRRDRLGQQQPTCPADQASWTYPLPLDWFNADPAAFLVELRCLDPAAVAVFPPLDAREIAIAELQPQLAPLLSPRSLLSPSQVLNWREGAALLSQPELAAWLLNQQIAVQRQQSQFDAGSAPTVSTPFILHPSSCYPEASNRVALTAAPKPAASFPLPRCQQAINVGLWLNDRLDQLAQDLSWTLMPAFAPTMALRSLEKEIENRGIWIPPNARGAYQDLRFEKFALRLYAVTWILSLTYKTCQWTLLLIVGPSPEHPLPPGISLQIRDQAQLLVEQTLKPEIQDGYLYAQVGGDSEEAFWATIDLNNGSAITLPPFTFKLEEP